MKDETPPPSPEVQEEQRVRTIKDRFKTEIAEMLAKDLFDKMAEYMEEHEKHLNYLDMIDASLAIFETLCFNQIEVSRQAGKLVLDDVSSRWAMQLLRMVEMIRADSSKEVDDVS